MAKTTTTQPDLMSIYERASAVATAPGFSCALGGWSAKAVQIDVSGYSQIYVEDAPHDPKNLMFVLVTNNPASKKFTVSEITEAQFDQFVAIEYDPRAFRGEGVAICRALNLAEAIAPNVLRHQSGKKEKAGGYRFA